MLVTPTKVRQIKVSILRHKNSSIISFLVYTTFLVTVYNELCESSNSIDDERLQLTENLKSALPDMPIYADGYADWKAIAEPGTKAGGTH